MRPGRTVKREASMTSWSVGGPALAPAVVTVSIRPLWITTAASRTGGAPVPSMSVPARRIFIASLPGWCQPTTGRRQRLKLYRESLPLDTAAVRPRLLGRRQMSGHAAARKEVGDAPLSQRRGAQANGARGGGVIQVPGPHPDRLERRVQSAAPNPRAAARGGPYQGAGRRPGAPARDGPTPVPGLERGHGGGLSGDERRVRADLRRQPGRSGEPRGGRPAGRHAVRRSEERRVGKEGKWRGVGGVGAKGK